MKDVPEEKRTCRYQAVLAAHIPGEKEIWLYEQSLEGKIAQKPKESLGFGYDPIVIVNGKYYSEFSDEERFKVSHRGRGAKELLKHLSCGGK